MRSGGRRASPTARQPESPDAAYAEAVKRLARQPQSRATLALRLARMGYADEAVRGALPDWRDALSEYEQEPFRAFGRDPR